MPATSESASTLVEAPRLYAFDSPLSHPEPLRLLGGKGVALRRLVELGFDVPPGFTITIPAVHALQSSATGWESLQPELEVALQRLAERAGTTWGRGPRPLTLAVRSGAVESRPGVMRTLLYCGWTSTLAAESGSPAAWAEYAEFLAGLLESSAHDKSEPSRVATRSVRLDVDAAEKLCHELRTRLAAQQDTPHDWLQAAIAAVIRSAPAGTSTAVTVQTMVTPDCSGVLRSRDPLRPEPSEMVIEFVVGTGLRMMSGSTTPNVLRLSRDPHRPATPDSDSNPSRDPHLAALSAELLDQLRRAALRLEDAAGEPVEVEWGAVGDRLVLFQYRAAQDVGPASRFVESEVTRLRLWAQQGRRWWVRHQLAESLPAPTPLTWSLWQQFVSPQGGLGTLYRRLGYAPPQFPEGTGCLELIAGRIYADPDRWAQLICRSAPWRYDYVRLAAAPEALQEPPTAFDPARLDPWFLLTWPQCVWVLWRARRRRSRLEQTAAAEFAAGVAPEYLTRLNELTAERASASPGVRLALAEAVRHWLFDVQAPQLLMPGWLGVQAWQSVAGELRERLPPAVAELVIGELLRQLDAEDESGIRTPGAAPFGWCETTALELSEAPREAATSLLDWAAACRFAVERYGRPAIPGESLHRLIVDRLGGDLSPSLWSALQTAAALLPLRGLGKQLFLAGYELLRGIVGDVAQQTGLGDQLYFATWKELTGLDRTPLDPATLRRQREEREFWMRRPVPAVIRGDVDQPLTLPPPCAPAETRPLRSLSRGQSHGVVWRPSGPAADVPPGAIVVVESADSPSVSRWRAAGGIIVEHGGLLSHAAVTARQLGVPMGVLPDAVRTLRAGAEVWLDADGGELRVVATTDFRPQPAIDRR